MPLSSYNTTINESKTWEMGQNHSGRTDGATISIHSRMISCGVLFCRNAELVHRLCESVRQSPKIAVEIEAANG